MCYTYIIKRKVGVKMVAYKIVYEIDFFTEEEYFLTEELAKKRVKDLIEFQFKEEFDFLYEEWLKDDKGSDILYVEEIEIKER